MKQNLLIGLLSFCLVGCHEKTFNTDQPWSKVADSIRSYYAQKYPVFAQLITLQNQQDKTLESAKRSSELLEICPVREIVNSFPNGPLLTFVECSELSKTTISIVTLYLYADKAGTCRLVVDVDTQQKKAGDAYSTLSPISESEILRLVTTANK